MTVALSKNSDSNLENNLTTTNRKELSILTFNW